MLELIIVVAVIAILISLLLPAIQQSREAARRTQCRGNLMNIGFALQNYESAFGVLPPGSVSRTAPVLNRLQDAPFSWIAQLLPHFEAGGTYRQIDFRQSPLAAANDRARMSVHSLLLCPSSAFDPKLSIPLSRPTPAFDANGPAPDGELNLDEFMGMGGDSESAIPAVSSMYAACHHDAEAPIDVDQNGVMHLNSGIGTREIPDGRSQTIAVGELIGDTIRNPGWMVGLRGALRNTGAPLVRTHPYGRPPAAMLSDVDLWWKFDNEEEAIAETGELSTEEANAARVRLDKLVGGFGGMHSGGTNFVFCDGAVRFISNSIDQALYRRMGSRRDGGLVELD